MSTVAEPMSDPLVQVRSRLADYVELTKPRIATMALVTVAVGYFLGSEPAVRWELFFATLLGAGLVAAGGSALNHWLERHADAKMNRTVNRPLPSGRLGLWEVFLFGVTLFVVGVGYLAWALPTPVAAIVAALTGTMYVAIYTPLKRLTTWNTLIGGDPRRVASGDRLGRRRWQSQPECLGLVRDPVRLATAALLFDRLALPRRLCSWRHGHAPGRRSNRWQTHRLDHGPSPAVSW